MPAELIGADLEKQESVEEFFRSIPMSERRRLFVFFQEMMGKEAPTQERDWSDKAKDGPRMVPGIPRTAPGSKAKVATAGMANGKPYVAYYGPGNERIP